MRTSDAIIAGSSQPRPRTRSEASRLGHEGMSTQSQSRGWSRMCVRGTEEGEEGGHPAPYRARYHRARYRARALGREGGSAAGIGLQCGASRQRPQRSGLASSDLSRDRWECGLGATRDACTTGPHPKHASSTPLHLVREHARDRRAAKRFGDLGDGARDLRVLVAGAHELDRDFRREVGRHEAVGLSGHSRRAHTRRG